VNVPRGVRRNRMWIQKRTGGASNSAGTAEHHYVLFGRQSDDQHPENSGVYFEFDDQIHGAVDGVAKVMIADGSVEFELIDQSNIVVRRRTEEPEWTEFLCGIHDVFGDEMVQQV